jgi:hypothetical protein
MSEYYKHDNEFDPEPMQEMLYKLNDNIRKILWGKNVTVSFSCKVDVLTWYDILIELEENYLYYEDFEALNKFMENSHYGFHSVQLSPDKHLLLKYVR